MKIKLHIFAFATVMLIFSACSKFLSENPKSIYTADNAIVDEAGLRAAVVGMYDGMIDLYVINTNTPIFLSMVGTDELCYRANNTNVRSIVDRYAYSSSEGCIGELRSVEASLCNQVPPQYIAHSYHTQPIQGGCLLDCGIYCASWLEDLMDGEVAVRQVSSSITSDIDYYVHADLTIGGRPALLECAFDRQKPRQAIIRGTEGHIVVDDLHRPQSMTICPDGRESQTIRMPYVVDDFYGEIYHFVRCLQEGIPESPIMSFGASIRCAHILDCIRENIPG